LKLLDLIFSIKETDEVIEGNKKNYEQPAG